MHQKIINISWLAGLLALGITASVACDVEAPEQLDEETVDEQLRDRPAEAELELSLDPQEMQAGNCRNGFRHRGDRLCISNLQARRTYQEASWQCKRSKSHVCSYEDLTYLYYETRADANYDPDENWIGNLVSDDQVLCGNERITRNDDNNIDNFEGTCNKSDRRNYWCCHDDAQ